MLSPRLADHWCVDSSEKPKLVVVVDTEEEFDWSRGFSRGNTCVRSMRRIGRIQDIFDEYHVTPVYVVDYPVVSHPEGYRPLQEIHAAGRCVIGAHLHPWVNPPFEEEVSRRNSFPGNLKPALEAAKLKTLGEQIAERFGVWPTVYKAGRYGIGAHTAGILEDQGYEVDLSACPHMDYSAEGGPDFTRITAWPYWFGRKRRLLELPLTIGFAGLLRRWGSGMHCVASQRPLASLYAVAALARLRLVDKVWLSPEGFLTSEHMRLVRCLLQDGLRIFSFAFHSPSAEPGNTPYVTSQRDLADFLARCRRFFDFFLGELGGEVTTPLDLKRRFTGAAFRTSHRGGS